MDKYIGLINIGDENDIEKFKRTRLSADVPEEILKDALGSWLKFDIDYLELFWMSKERREILDEGLVLAIKKKVPGVEY